MLDVSAALTGKTESRRGSALRKLRPPWATENGVPYLVFP
jgi:hypothetical protein